MAAEFDVRYVARLARLQLSDSEASQFQAQLTDVLGYIAALDRLDVEGLEPTVHAEELDTVCRQDLARPGLTAAAALANSPATNAGLFLTPRVVE
jgi:aspartyl-tRNA(Asn)/glutamyl-tRNA(Gln) amidotransferase subunit C